jgi:hypothetical protein
VRHHAGEDFPVPSASPEMGFLRERIHPEQLTRDECKSFNSEDVNQVYVEYFQGLGAHVMGDVIQFIPKSALERARLVREARAMYESVFPTEKGPASQQRDSQGGCDA